MDWDLSDSMHCKVQSGVTRERMSNNFSVGNSLRAATKEAIESLNMKGIVVPAHARSNYKFGNIVKSCNTKTFRTRWWEDFSSIEYCTNC